MATYKKILVTVDFSPVAGKVVERAKQVAGDLKTQLDFVTVVEYLPPIQPADDLMMGVPVTIDERQMVEWAKERFARLSEEHGLAGYSCEVLVGDVRRTITEHAKEFCYDLIIVGSHGRRGLSRLLGSTADTVLHHAHCDVLAVRAEELSS